MTDALPSGRAVLLAPEIADALVQAVGDGAPLKTALLALGISRSAFFEWMAIAAGRRETWHDGSPVSEGVRVAVSALSDRLTRAKAERALAAVRRLQEAARQLDKFGRPDWKADAWLLTHSPDFRDEWGERVEVRHSGTVDHQLHDWARGASDAELLDAAPELAMLLPPEEAAP